MRRILVLRGGALGDFLVTLPALQALRQSWPTARIELVGNPPAAALAVAHGILDHVESQHAAPWHQLYSGQLTTTFRQRLAAYDCVLSFWPDPDGDLAKLFPLRANQIYVSAPAQPTTLPAARHFNATVQSITGQTIPDWIRLHPNHAVTDTIALHPGSGSRSKNWPLSRWLELARWLRRSTQLQPVFVLGEAERDLVIPADFAQWRDWSLADLAVQLARCRLFVGHDSGVSHLAGACCRAGLLLFGPTNPQVWAPPNPAFRIIVAGGDLATITVDQVRREIGAILADQT